MSDNQNPNIEEVTEVVPPTSAPEAVVSESQ